MTTSSARSLEGKVSAISGRTFGRLAIASVVYYVLAVLAMHLVQPELDPLAVPMSVYVLGAYGSVMTTTFFVLCAGILGVGFGLIQTLPRTGAIKVAFSVTLIASAGFLIAGIFPTDWPPPMRSTSSQLHVLGGLLAFPSMIKRDVPVFAEIPKRWVLEKGIGNSVNTLRLRFRRVYHGYLLRRGTVWLYWPSAAPILGSPLRLDDPGWTSFESRPARHVRMRKSITFFARVVVRRRRSSPNNGHTAAQRARGG